MRPRLVWVRTPRRRESITARWTCWHTECRRYGVHRAVSLLECEHGRVLYYAVLIDRATCKAVRILSTHRKRKSAATACQKHANANRG